MNKDALLKDVFFTIITNVLSMICLVLVTKLLCDLLGPEGFGGYSLVRRYIGILAPIVILCLNISIPRYIGMFPKDRQKVIDTFFSGTILFLFALLLLLIIFCFLEDKKSVLLFFTTDMSLLLPSFLLLGGLGLHLILYSYYRGIMEMNIANLIQILFSSIIPLVVIILLTDYLDLFGVIMIFAVSHLLVLPIFAFILIKNRVYLCRSLQSFKKKAMNSFLMESQEYRQASLK